MKTTKFLPLALCLCAFTTTNLFAQARVNFTNNSKYPLRLTDGTISQTGVILTAGSVTQTLGNASTATFGIGPASVRVELFAGLSSAHLTPVLIGSTANAWLVTNTANDYVEGAQGSFNGGSVLPLPGVDGSAPLFFQFRAWSIGVDDAQSFSDRLLSGTGFAGISELISATPTLTPSIPAILFGSGPNQWQGLTLYTVVPEPATTSLFGLGLLAALAVRRMR